MNPEDKQPSTIGDVFIKSALKSTIKDLDSETSILVDLLRKFETVTSMELGNVEKATTTEPVELPHHSQLKPEYQGMYVRYDSSCPDQHWGTEPTVVMALNVAYNWWKKGYQPTCLIGDLSAQNFGATGCHTAHKTGTHVDLDLAATLPSDPGYNQDKQKRCAIILWFSIQLGVRRALFSDAAVASAVNQAAADKGFPGRVEVRADHDNHFHLEM